MLRKKKKKEDKPLLTFTNNKQKLHSKSTYFYKQWLDSFSSLRKQFANGFWVNLSSSREGGSTPNIPSANRTRFSLKDTNPYSKLTCGGVTYLLPCACSIALLLVLGLCINPFLPSGGGEEKAYAAITEDLGNGASISLSIYNNGNEVADNGMVSTEVQSGQVSYISNTIKVNTTKIAKYYIGVQSATASSNLTGSNTGVTIAGVGSNVTPGNFGDNTWGYALTDNITATDLSLAYSTLPAYSASTSPQYASANNPANGEHELKLTFAAKIRADKPADHYQAQALVSVAAEAKVITSWSELGLSTMQGMTNSICSNADENTTGQLRDTRDNKTYWVTKLKDGNCWMTQNLALDLSTSKPLTSTDSDVSSSWTPTANTQQGTITKFPSDSDLTFSYDSGEYIYTTPMAQNNCGSSSVTKLAGCPSWTNISGLSKDTSGNTQAHYLAGNYYSYQMATAGTGSSATTLGVDASDSICPKGWKLPTGYAGSRQFDTLINGLTSNYTDTVNNITLAPYYFVRSGVVDAFLGSSLKYAGWYGNYWSSTAGNSEMIHMYFDSRISVASNSGWRYAGMSVRCIAK